MTVLDSLDLVPTPPSVTRGDLLGGAPQSHQSFRRAGADPFGPFGVRAQYPLDGDAGNRGQLGDAIDAQTFLAHQQ